MVVISDGIFFFVRPSYAACIRGDENAITVALARSVNMNAGIHKVLLVPTKAAMPSSSFPSLDSPFLALEKVVNPAKNERIIP
jgi:hypothetical protein